MRSDGLLGWAEGEEELVEDVDDDLGEVGEELTARILDLLPRSQ